MAINLNGNAESTYSSDISAAAGTFSGDLSAATGTLGVNGTTEGTWIGQGTGGAANPGYFETKVNATGQTDIATFRGQVGFATIRADGSANFCANKLDIGADGTTKIGGTLPASPNITLNANGSATYTNLVALTTTVSGINMMTFQKNGVMQARVTSNGSIFALDTTLQQQTSERRLKENIVAINAETSWDTIKSTPYYAYNFIGDDSVRYGPMADEVPDEMRIATDQSDDVGVIHTYDNGMLQARLYVALQTALTRIEALEAKVQQLEGGTN